MEFSIKILVGILVILIVALVIIAMGQNFFTNAENIAGSTLKGIEEALKR